MTTLPPFLRILLTELFPQQAQNSFSTHLWVPALRQFLLSTVVGNTSGSKFHQIIALWQKTEFDIFNLKGSFCDGMKKPFTYAARQGERSEGA